MSKRVSIVFLGGFLVLMLMIAPAQRGTVTVRCPGGPAATTYYYDLVGDNYLETITVEYSPRDPLTGHATLGNVPMGTYRLLENGMERARITVTPEDAHILIEPGEDWPIMPPSGKE